MRNSFYLFLGFALAMFITFLTLPTYSQQTKDMHGTSIQSLDQLKATIDKIRLKTNTPGLAVGVIDKSNKPSLYFSGFADLETRAVLDRDSQFRFGSIAKMFVSLSILKLNENGQLSLNDTLSSIAPEVSFNNQWEAEYPTRLVHLLNHSSGWDSPHLIENVPLGKTPPSIIDVLNIYEESRTARWPPGSSIAYNNTGFLVAAYIVEKISGQRYEDFVQDNFFSALNMNDSGYFYSQHYRNNAVATYKGNQRLPYNHINNRASGALNSTLEDMLSFVRFLVEDSGRGLLKSANLLKFRKPSGTLLASSGVELLPGPGNQVFHQNGALMYGHEGSVQGMNSMLVYSPEHKFAYVIVANNNGPAVRLVHQLLSEFFTKDLTGTDVSSQRTINTQDKALSGWYKNITPVSSKFSFVSNLVPWKLEIKNESSSIKALIGSNFRPLIPNASNGFKQYTTGLNALVPFTHPEFGEIVYYGNQSLKKVSVISAFLPLAILFLWLLLSLSAILFLMIWLPRRLLRKPINKADILLRSAPLVSLVFALIIVICLHVANNQNNVFEALGKMSLFSISIFIGTLGFFISSLWSIRVLIQQRSAAKALFAKWHSTIFILANALMSILLLFYGFIGLRLWA